MLNKGDDRGWNTSPLLFYIENLLYIRYYVNNTKEKEEDYEKECFYNLHDEVWLAASG